MDDRKSNKHPTGRKKQIKEEKIMKERKLKFPRNAEI